MSEVYKRISIAESLLSASCLADKQMSLTARTPSLWRFPTWKRPQWAALQGGADAELSVPNVICSFTIRRRKCSPQLQTLKPNASNMSLTRDWMKPRKNAVGSTLSPPFQSRLRFLLFCCYRHFNTLLNIVFPVKVLFVLSLLLSGFTDEISFLMRPSPIYKNRLWKVVRTT